MSFSVDSIQGVKIRNTKRRGAAFALFLVALEGIFTFFLYLSLAGRIFAPPEAQSAAGVPNLISYQGRLTDTSGNPLGGTGTLYCFRYSIYDAASGGNKVWPAGTPTNTTTTVTDGVFSDQVGRMDDLSGLDFLTTSTLYLQVAVNTVTSTCSGSWEDLTPRQQITSNAWAQTAESVYGAALRTPTSTKVQIGTGSGIGAGSQTVLSLDVANTADSLGGACTNNGALWYNSTLTRALVCENGVINVISNSSTTIAGIGVNAGAPVTAGNIVFSNSNGVTFGMNGSTITASVNAGGGGATVSHWPHVPAYLATSSQYTGATGAGTNITASYYVGPLQVLQNLTFRSVNMIANFATVAGTGSQSIAYMVGIYTLNGGTALSRLSSFMWRNEVSQNSVTAQSHRFYWGTDSNANSSSSAGNISTIVSGIRKIPLYTNGGDSLSAGQYWLVVAQTNRSSSVAVMPANSVARFSGSINTAGNFATASTFNVNSQWLNGIFSSTSAVGDFLTPIMPASVHTSVITSTGGSSQQQKPYINLVW